MFGINEFSYQNNCIGSWIWWHEIFLMIAVSKLDEVRWNVWLKVSNEGKWKKDLYAWNWSAHITQRTLLMVGNCVSPAWRIEHTWIYILYKYLRWWTYIVIFLHIFQLALSNHTFNATVNNWGSSLCTSGSRDQESHLFLRGASGGYRCQKRTPRVGSVDLMKGIYKEMGQLVGYDFVWCVFITYQSVACLWVLKGIFLTTKQRFSIRSLHKKSIEEVSLRTFDLRFLLTWCHPESVIDSLSWGSCS